jgi:hypothetical protein
MKDFKKKGRRQAMKLASMGNDEYIPGFPSWTTEPERCGWLLSGDHQRGFLPDHFSLFSHRRYPDCQCLNFGSWFLFSFPAAIILLLLSWVWLQWLFLGFK